MATEIRPTFLERAFILARSGQCTSITELRRCLRAEGYSDRALVGRTLHRQLADLCRQSRRVT